MLWIPSRWGGACVVSNAQNAIWMEIVAISVLGGFTENCTGVVPAHMVLFHYLNDLLILGECGKELEEVTRRMVQALRDEAFLVSP